MVKTLYKIGRKGMRVSKTGILFRQVKSKGSSGKTLIYAEKKFGSKNVEAIRKGKKVLVFRRIKRKAKFV